MNEKKVSIILPVYNGEKYIEECIHSVIVQTYKQWELIICDDGSTDSTKNICQKYADRDNRIRYFYQKNNGVSSARNTGIDLSSGEYITFIDADDIYKENKLYRQMELCSEYDADIVYTELERFIGESNNINYVDNPNHSSIDILNRENAVYRALCGGGGASYVVCALIKSNIAKTFRFKNIRFAEDFLYLLDCFTLADKIVLSDETLYFYRKDNQASMMSNITNRKYANDFEKLPSLFYTYMKKNNFSDICYRQKMGKEIVLAGVRLSRCLHYKEFKIHFKNLLNKNEDAVKWSLGPKEISHMILWYATRFKWYFIYGVYALIYKVRLSYKV